MPQRLLSSSVFLSTVQTNIRKKHLMSRITPQPLSARNPRLVSFHSPADKIFRPSYKYKSRRRRMGASLMTLPQISSARSRVVTHLDKGYLCGESLFAPAEVWDRSVSLNLQDVVQSFQSETKTKGHLWRSMSFSLLTRKIRELWRGKLVPLYVGICSATVAKYA